MTLLPLVLAGALAAPAWADPLAEPLAKLAADGYKPVARIEDTVAKTRFAAVIVREESKARDRLYGYVVMKGRAIPVYIEPNMGGGPLEFDETGGRKRFPDLLRDGSHALAYRSHQIALRESVLHIRRIEGLKFKAVGDFLEGRILDLDGDGRYEFSSNSAPLGRFFMAECGQYGTMAKDAYRTDLLAWSGGRFVSVARRFPGFYRERLRRDEEALASLEESRGRSPGRYLSAALILFFDKDSLGDRRDGWDRLSKALQPPAMSPPGSKSCAEKVRADLRRRLAIPEDWQ